MTRGFIWQVSLLAFACFISSCGGGGGGSGSGIGGSDAANFGCDGSCAHQSLSAADVETILKQAVYAAKNRAAAANIAVLDRVGNVLAVYKMAGAVDSSVINGQIGAAGGLEGKSVPSALAAISKAGTGAYLSSQGNAFSTRTASQIVQEHFDPGEQRAPGGPLFGVQFSQLICSDLTVLNPALGAPNISGRLLAAGSVGPRPLPLGLSADPGGLPLYKNGDLVGGIGVEIDGQYSLDRNIEDYDDSIEERVALAGSVGFETPSERAADRIFVGGRTLHLTDLSYNDLSDDIGQTDLDPAGLISVGLFSNGKIRAGVPFGTSASGVSETVRAGAAAAILVDGNGNPRFPTRPGTHLASGSQLTASEVDALLDSALLTADRARAAIRKPDDTRARVSIFVVDTAGIPLGFVRSQDAPVFGIDVALQKARSVAFFSSGDAAARLTQASGSFSRDYVGAAQALMGSGALSNGFAISNRAIGNLARPFFPDGIDGLAPGPLSLPFPGQSPGPSWSPFNDGLQLDLSLAAILAPLGGQVPATCAPSSIFGRRLANGLQIFSGAVPLYKNGTLVGGIGISGDGIFQDDLVAFFGASRKGLDFAGHTGVGDSVLGFNAPLAIRSDTLNLAVSNSRLRYVNCPEAPFIGDNSQDVCSS